MEESINNLIKEYSKRTYLDLYGGSLTLSIIFFIVFFILFSYIYIQNNIQPIKSNWNSQKCNPMVIPFAGFINKPDNKTNLEFTSENFNMCINNILINIAGDFIKPITYLSSFMNTMLFDIMDTIQTIRKKFDSVISNIENIDKEIMGRVFNFVMPIQFMVIKMRDLIQKINGTLVTSIFTVISGYFGIKSFLGAFVEIMIIGLVSLAAIIVPLLFFVFTLPLAVFPLLVFTVVAGYTISIVAGLNDIIEKTSSSIPPKPMCFDGNTKITLINGTQKSIKDIKTNEVLINGSVVTAIFKVSRNKMSMYNFKDVIVSGNHSIKISKNKWKRIDEMKESKKLQYYNEDFLYCLNTSNKEIIINNYVFSDWDDLEDLEIALLYRNVQSLSKNILPDENLFKISHLHKYLDSGFSKDTIIQLHDNTYKYIDELQIGDIIKGKNTILGIVKINALDIDVYKYKFKNNKNIIASNNIMLKKNGKILSSIFKTNNGKDLVEYITPHLYHLITDTGIINIDNNTFLDYNGALEKLL